MSFCWVTLNVRNLEESLKFYREIVGLEISNRFNAGPRREIVFLGSGKTKVELIYDEAELDINLGKNISLGFEVNSLDEKIIFVKEKGLEIHSGPFQPNPSVRFFYVEDPNGLRIQFVENIK